MGVYTIKSIGPLILFHLVFFRKFYFQNPFIYATSEPLDTAFPSSQLLGRCLRETKRISDPYYYPHYSSIPFLSAYYPVLRLQAWIGSFLSVDSAFRLYSFTMVLHFLFSSIGAYLLFSQFGPLLAFFGAITFGYMGYAIKQNSCINYTLPWIPWVFWGADIHSPIITGISLGMMMLAGYWPIGIYIWPLTGLYWLTRSVS